MLDIIYTSEKICPYVYIGIHKFTKEYYIGYREINQVPSSADLGSFYFTSSKKVKKLGFDNFNWTIFAEFFDGIDAFNLEQELIKDNISNPLCLNQRYYSACHRRVFIKHSTETKAKISKSILGRTKETHDSIKKMSQTLLGRNKSNNAGVAQMAQKLSGRAKETHSSVASQAQKIKGRTKYTDIGVLSMSKSLRRYSDEIENDILSLKKLNHSVKEKKQHFDNLGIIIPFTTFYGIIKRKEADETSSASFDILSAIATNKITQT